MTLDQLKVYRLALRDKLRQLDGITPTCMSCRNFASGDVCAQFDAMPPEEFRRTPEACASWVHDEVPF